MEHSVSFLRSNMTFYRSVLAKAKCGKARSDRQRAKHIYAVVRRPGRKSAKKLNDVY